MEAPNPNLQAPEKLQSTNSKPLSLAGCWNLNFGASLELGGWSLGFSALGFRALIPTLAVVGAVPAQAQPDYGPAIWNPAYPGHWYTTGYAHAFCVIHDMEGYYLSTISYFQRSTTQASIHYAVN